LLVWNRRYFALFPMNSYLQFVVFDRFFKRWSRFNIFKIDWTM